MSINNTYNSNLRKYSRVIHDENTKIRYYDSQKEKYKNDVLKIRHYNSLIRKSKKLIKDTKEYIQMYKLYNR